MVLSWFSSSAADKDKVETERSGYECAPYTVLETTPGYQVNTALATGLSFGCNAMEVTISVVLVLSFFLAIKISCLSFSLGLIVLFVLRS